MAGKHFDRKERRIMHGILMSEWSKFTKSSSRLVAKRLPTLARLGCQLDRGRETGISESGTPTRAEVASGEAYLTSWGFRKPYGSDAHFPEGRLGPVCRVMVLWAVPPGILPVARCAVADL